jgi:hypothetical protein
MAWWLDLIWFPINCTIYIMYYNVICTFLYLFGGCYVVAICDTIFFGGKPTSAWVSLPGILQELSGWKLPLRIACPCSPRQLGRNLTGKPWTWMMGSDKTGLAHLNWWVKTCKNHGFSLFCLFSCINLGFELVWEIVPCFLGGTIIWKIRILWRMGATRFNLMANSRINHPPKIP